MNSAIAPTGHTQQIGTTMNRCNQSMSFREMLAADRFFYGVEMVTTRGMATADSANDLVPIARALLDEPRIGWISLTDNPGGVPMLPPDWFVGLVPEQLARVVLHLTWLLESRRLNLPILGNVHVLNRATARLFNRNRLPGCVVTDELMTLVNQYARGADHGRKFFWELAAKQVAVFRGLNFAGACLGGVASADSAGRIIDMAEGFGENDWREFVREIQFAQPGEFFLFEHDPETGLSDATRINPEYLASLTQPGRSREVNLNYRISRWVHRWAFTRGRRLYGLLSRIYARWDKNPGLLSRLAYWMERQAKRIMYDCQDCGDCALSDCGFLCPVSACAKGQRNGPCGGTLNGRCEVYDVECLWCRAYERAKAHRESEQLLERPVITYNADLRRTSAWANTYLGRDYRGTAALESSESRTIHPQT